MIETIEQLRAAVYGQAVGDALGVPYEFQDRDSFACANMIGHGTHNQPAGTWSDDTSMMLATLDSLIGNDWQVDIEDMQHRFNAWLYDGEYAIDGNVFDCGNTVREALHRGHGLLDSLPSLKAGDSGVIGCFPFDRFCASEGPP